MPSGNRTATGAPSADEHTRPLIAMMIATAAQAPRRFIRIFKLSIARGYLLQDFRYVPKLFYTKTVFADKADFRMRNCSLTVAEASRSICFDRHFICL